MLICDGYKMFHGTVKITPKSDRIKPFELTGTWLFKFDTGYWYCEPDDGGITQSFGESVMTIIREDVG